MHGERGFILPMVIFSLAIMGVLVLVIVSTSDDDRLGSRYDLEGTRSFNAAEAGLADILTDWKADGYEGIVSLVGKDTTLAWATLPNNAGRYRATILKVDASTYMLTVDGQSAGGRKGLRTVQLMLVPAVSFRYAIFGASASGGSKFGANPGPQTDSYDSALGPYAPGGTDGDMYTNGNVAINGPTNLSGDLWYGGTKTGGGTLTVSGTTTSGAPFVPAPAISCPVGAFTASVPPATGTGTTNYSAATGNLSVQQSGGGPYVLTLTGTSYYFNNVSILSGATLAISSGGLHVDIYVKGTWLSDNGHINNTSQNATLLTIWGCDNTSTSTWTLAGGGLPDPTVQATNGAYFAIYAPKHPLKTTHPYDMYGALVGASLDDSPGAHIHYDEALGRVPSVVLVPGSWTEITR